MEFGADAENDYIYGTDYVSRQQLEYDILEDNIDNHFLEKHNLIEQLPLELLINYNDFTETFRNLYTYFLKHEYLGNLPELFLQEYVYTYTEKVFFNNNHNELLKELKTKF
jgi:hypothetical protein|tara:strand:+ start:327 stop:659 length:333 start_codon:yes stop_codon:yes gene_type:complete